MKTLSRGRKANLGRGRVQAKKFAVSAERRVAMWERRKEGKTLREISDEFGIDQSVVSRHLKQQMEEFTAQELEYASHYRAEHIVQLEKIQGAYIGKAETGDVKATEMVLKIKDQLAKLQGCYAPVRQEVTGKDGAPIVDAGLIREQLLARLKK